MITGPARAILQRRRAVSRFSRRALYSWWSSDDGKEDERFVVMFCIRGFFFWRGRFMTAGRDGRPARRTEWTKKLDYCRGLGFNLRRLWAAGELCLCRLWRFLWSLERGEDTVKNAWRNSSSIEKCSQAKRARRNSERKPTNWCIHSRFIVFFSCVSRVRWCYLTLVNKKRIVLIFIIVHRFYVHAIKIAIELSA